MSDVMTQLHQDHKNVERLLDFLVVSIDQVKAGCSLDVHLLHDVMFYMTHYPDIFHHPREDLVFERLLLRDPQSRLAIKELLEEHTTLLDEGQALLEAVKKARDGENLEADELLSATRQYECSMRAHMNKEEGKVFPLAKLLLTSQDWVEIDLALKTKMDPLFGQVVDEKLQSLARKIKDYDAGRAETR